MSAVSEASCLICGTPLSGLLGGIGRVAGIKRSSQNPNLCNRCDIHVVDGSIVELAVFFADLTSFTTLTRELGPQRTHELVDGFLRMAKEVVVKWDGFVVQFAGDEIMALFNVPLSRDDHRRRAVAAAGELQRGMRELSERFGMDLQVTVGIACGHARVGRPWPTRSCTELSPGRVSISGNGQDLDGPAPALLFRLPFRRLATLLDAP